MKTLMRRFYCAIAGCIFTANFFPAVAADTNVPPRLTVELRDGSRVIGTSEEKNFKFHSALLGDLKLAVKDIRSVECVSSNSAKLSTANGDLLTVSFVDSKLAVKTSFGKVDLAVDSVRTFFVSPGGMGGHPPGLVALWSGEGDGNDSVGGHSATLTDMSFAEGKVGQAFSFNGTSSYFKIPDTPALNVGESKGLTISAWIKPSDVNGFHPILEWNPSDTIPGVIGVQLWIGHRPESQGVLQAAVVGVDRNPHILISPPGMVAVGSFQHVAVTYDKTSGVGVLYLNGTIVAQSEWGSFVPLTIGPLSSFRPSNPGDWTYNKFFAGVMDELAIYNRALSASEIQTLCKDENNGQLPPVPAPGAAMSANGIFRNGFNE